MPKHCIFCGLPIWVWTVGHRIERPLVESIWIPKWSSFWRWNLHHLYLLHHSLCFGRGLSALASISINIIVWINLFGKSYLMRLFVFFYSMFYINIIQYCAFVSYPCILKSLFISFLFILSTTIDPFHFPILYRELLRYVKLRIWLR